MSGIYRTTRGTGRDGGGDAAGARIATARRSFRALAGGTAGRPRGLRDPAFRAGAVAVITMLYMLLLSTLTLALFYAASYNVQVSDNFSGISRAHAAAESGLRWMDYRFKTAARPKTSQGRITTSVATTLWPQIRDAIKADLETVRGADKLPLVVKTNSSSLEAKGISIDASSGATFDVLIRQLGPADGLDARWVRVSTTGRYKKSARTVSMDFRMDKSVKFAVVGKVPLQIGRDVIIDGPIGMGTPGKYPPIYMLSDFMHFDTATLKPRVQAFQTYLKGSGVVDGRVVKNHEAFDNRISVNDADEFKLATAAGYKDYNNDSFIDEYDIFLERFDANKDRQLTKAEFTNPGTGQLYDANLFALIDGLSPPLLTEDKNGNGILDPGEDINGDMILQGRTEDLNGNLVLDAGEDKNGNGRLDVEGARQGFADGIVDNRDGYAKIRGGLTLSTSASAWSTNLAASGKKIQDMIGGPIATTDPTEPALQFSATTDDIFDLSPVNFEACSLNYKAKSGLGGGAASTTTTGLPVGTNAIVTNSTVNATLHATLPAAAKNSGTLVVEKTPYGSTTWQAQYTRPKFVKVTFRNCIIEKGLNAVFDGCTFEGVTFVDVQRNITSPAGAVTYNKDEAMTWSKRMKSGATFSTSTSLTKANSYGFEEGNNIRFNDCTFKGPLVSPYTTAYSHFTNSWEFTGATTFDNSVDQTATIVAPQTNIEMGSFTTSGKPSKLVGVVVAGNIDIRGTTTIDGSIVVTGDGAGNTTLGYFGNNDGETDPTAMPEGGYGRIVLRYNPYRTMPDGINTAVDLAPFIASYREGAPQ